MSLRGYRLYGLTLQSALELPCRRASTMRRPDVRLLAAGAERFARARRAVKRGNAAWFASRRLANGATYLRWRGHFEFLVSASGGRILYRQLRHSTPESLHVHLLGHVLSFSLLARGSDPLHGTVVETDGGAIAFVGECGYGKSTLAAALLVRGHRIVTDDLVALRRHGERWLVHPGIPRLKLSPHTASRLLGRIGTAPMIHGSAKRVVPLTALQSVNRLLPLRAIYALAPPADALKIDALAPPDAFLEIISAAFNLTVLERARHANQFAMATRLVRDVPVRRLTYPRDLSRLREVCDAVLADAAAR